MTRKQLEKLRSNVDTAIERVTQKEHKAARHAAEKAAKAFGFTLSDITTGAAPKPKAVKAKTPAAPKYANPQDKSQTWSGRCRQPEWFKAALASGQDPETLAI